MRGPTVSANEGVQVHALRQRTNVENYADANSVDAEEILARVRQYS